MTTFICPGCLKHWPIKRFPFHCLCGAVAHSATEVDVSRVAKAPYYRRPQVPAYGPGSELAKLVKELGLKKVKNCGCGQMAVQMNAWCIAGCRENRGLIVEQLEKNYQLLTWRETLAAGWKGKWIIDLFDPAGSLVDEALRRAAIPKPAYVDIDSLGWGDIAICAYICEGTKHTTRPLVMCATGAKAEHIRMLGLEPADPAVARGKFNWSGSAEMADGKTPRLKFYAEHHGVPDTPQQPTLTLPPEYECTDPAVDRRTVLCFPTSSGIDREWSIPYWNMLCQGLIQAGLKPLVFPTRHQHLYEHAIDVAPMGRLAGYMQKAGMFVGPDSGPANWAAVVKLPGVVLLGPTKPLIFTHAPLLKCLQSDLPCTGCCFVRKHEPWCSSACLSLANITPARVLQEVVSYHGVLYPR